MSEQVSLCYTVDRFLHNDVHIVGEEDRFNGY